MCGLLPMTRWSALEWHIFHGTGYLTDPYGTSGCESTEASPKSSGAASQTLGSSGRGAAFSRCSSSTGGIRNVPWWILRLARSFHAGGVRGTSSIVASGRAEK